jgi:hypothetical protein
MSGKFPEAVRPKRYSLLVCLFLLVFGSLGLAGVALGLLLIEANGKAALCLEIKQPGKTRRLIAYFGPKLDQNVLNRVFKKTLMASESVGFPDFVEVMAV